MKKILTTTFALLFLLSGMHLSLASHYCGGALAATRWSFNEAKATCGMEKPGESGLAGILIHEACCQDAFTQCTVDNQYNFQTFSPKSLISQQIRHFAVPASPLFKSQTPVNQLYACVLPPGDVQPSHVYQEDICVFLI